MRAAHAAAFTATEARGAFYARQTVSALRGMVVFLWPGMPVLGMITPVRHLTEQQAAAALRRGAVESSTVVYDVVGLDPTLWTSTNDRRWLHECVAAVGLATPYVSPAAG